MSELVGHPQNWLGAGEALIPELAVALVIAAVMVLELKPFNAAYRAPAPAALSTCKYR
jgi:hypothetical protein